ncbi:hypothetical protein BC629DRAFT_1439324 [Irpex lacteus]|nr:hypothetical protein BC629DRAFT_1439324 [Irpex lacteus]
MIFKSPVAAHEWAWCFSVLSGWTESFRGLTEEVVLELWTALRELVWLLVIPAHSVWIRRRWLDRRKDHASGFTNWYWLLATGITVGVEPDIVADAPPKTSDVYVSSGVILSAEQITVPKARTIIKPAAYSTNQAVYGR